MIVRIAVASMMTGSVLGLWQPSAASSVQNLESAFETFSAPAGITEQSEAASIAPTSGHEDLMLAVAIHAAVTAPLTVRASGMHWIEEE